MEREYIVLSLENEYPGFTENYPETREIIHEALLVSREIGKAINRFQFNDQKFRFRYGQGDISLEDLPQDTENPEKKEDSYTPEMETMLNLLSETQHRRVLKHWVEGYSFSEIAEQEHCSVSAVSEAVKRGTKRMQKNSQRYLQVHGGVRHE